MYKTSIVDREKICWIVGATSNPAITALIGVLLCTVDIVWLIIPPFYWASICFRSKPIWKLGPIGNKRELNGSDRKLIGNERQRSGMVGKVRVGLQRSKIAPDLRRSGTGRRSSVRSSVSWSSLIVNWSYESGTQRVLISVCRISSRSYLL